MAMIAKRAFKHAGKRFARGDVVDLGRRDMRFLRAAKLIEPGIPGEPFDPDDALFESLGIEPPSKRVAGKIAEMLLEESQRIRIVQPGAAEE